MAKVCIDICLNLGNTQIEMSDVSGIYPSRAKGWRYDAGDTVAIPTTDIATAILTLTRGGTSWALSINTANYVDPASTDMAVLDIATSSVSGLTLTDGLYEAVYALTFSTPENCAEDGEQTILLTRSLEACLTKLWTSIIKDCVPSTSIKTEYDKLCMELYALKAAVNCGTISTDDEVQEIITDLAARCAALSQECNC
jgi:hypothetical protein